MNFNKVISLLILVVSIVDAKEYLIGNIKEYQTLMRKKVIQPGDIITLKNGIYKNVKINFKANGTYDKPIILRAQTPSKVIITGKSSLQIFGDFLIVKDLVFKDGEPASNPLIALGHSNFAYKYCRLTNIVIDNFNRKNLDEKYHWVMMSGSHHRVDHCKFTHMKNKGVTLKVWITKNQQPNYNIIDHNEFSYRKASSKNGYETIRIGNSKVSLQSSKTLVANNYFYHCDGEIEIVSNKSCENSYIHNTFKNSKGMLTLRHGNNCLVKDNYFINTDNSFMGGIRVIGEGHKLINNYFYNIGVSPSRAAISLINGKKNEVIDGYLPVKNIDIEHNKFINTDYTIYSGANYKKTTYNISPKNVKFINNLFVKTQKLFTYKGTKPNYNFQNNILYQTFNQDIIKSGRYIDPALKNKHGIFLSNIAPIFTEKQDAPIIQKDVGPTWLK